MRYLHQDPELFKEVVQTTAVELQRPVAIVEKDYYVTMILKLLSERAPQCVFKGGTSLSKCHHVIDRFSEDIDIAFSEHLTQGQRKILKDDTIAGISKELDMPIIDWANAQSKRNYNCYTFSYRPIEGFIPESMIPGVKLEVTLASLAFPTVPLPVDSYVYQFLKQDDLDIVDEFALQPFTMTLQRLDRTLIDKTFAICDYYLQQKVSGDPDKTKRHSRHIYDIHMLLPQVPLDADFAALVKIIREQRSSMPVCLSARPGVDVPALLQEIIDLEVYKEDYKTITTYFQRHPVSYEQIITALQALIESHTFE